MKALSVLTLLVVTCWQATAYSESVLLGKFYQSNVLVKKLSQQNWSEQKINSLKWRDALAFEFNNELKLGLNTLKVKPIHDQSLALVTLPSLHHYQSSQAKASRGYGLEVHYAFD